MDEKQLKRLSDCEVVIGKYHDELRGFREQVVNYNNQIISKSEFDVMWQDLSNRISRDLGMIRKEMSDLALDDRENAEHVSAIQLLQNNHHAMLYKHEERLNGLQGGIEGSLVHHASHEKKLAILNAKMPNWEKISLEYEEFKKNMYLLLSQKGENIDTLRDLFYDLQKTQHTDRYKVNECDSNLQSMFTKIAEMRSQIYDRLDEIRLSIDAKVSQAKSEMSSKMEQIKLPEPAEVKDMQPLLDQFKEELKRSHESLVLDVSNARAKSDVNEMQMKIFEKKLDNIYLMLKKNELTQ